MKTGKRTLVSFPPRGSSGKRAADYFQILISIITGRVWRHVEGDIFDKIIIADIKNVIVVSTNLDRLNEYENRR
jgi:hypothetical protein